MFIVASILFLLTNSITAQHFGEINDFSLKLFSAIYAFEEPIGLKNFAVSPIAIWNIFALISEGAAGQTFEEITDGLKIPIDAESMKGLRAFVNTVFRRNNVDVKLKRQSFALVDQSLKVHREFCETVHKYDTKLYIVDPVKVHKLASNINYYACLATDGKIRKVVDFKLLNDVRLLLIDATYFKANWTVSFDPSETRKEAFYDDRGREKGFKDMMHRKLLLATGYSNDLEANVFELPYGRDRSYSMIIILPLMSLNKVMEKMQYIPFKKILKVLGSKEKLDVAFPRFKITSEVNMMRYLQYLGIHNVFDKFRAELPGISDFPVHISQVLQKTGLEFSEEGTIGSVVTSVSIESKIGDDKVEFNRPFAFFIFDKKSNVILYAGVYKDPDDGN